MPEPFASPLDEREPRVAEAKAIIEVFLLETNARQRTQWEVPDPKKVPAGEPIFLAEPETKAALVIVALDRLLESPARREPEGRWWALNRVIAALTRSSLPFRGSDVDALLDLLATRNQTWAGWTPIVELASALERWAGDRGFTPSQTETIARIAGSAESRYLTDSERKGLRTLLRLAGQEQLYERNDDWGAAVYEYFSGLESAQLAAARRLLRHASTASSSKPSTTWLARAQTTVTEVGEAFAAAVVADLLVRVASPVSGRNRFAANGNKVPTASPTEHNGNVLRGLAWIAPLAREERTASALGKAAIACFAKLPGHGARSAKVGTACINALAEIASLEAVAELTSVRERVKLASAKRQIDEALESAARKAGISRDDLEDLAVPTFGLVDRKVARTVGPYRVELTFTPGNRVALLWFNADGKPRKTVPSEVKRSHGDELDAIKSTVSDLETTLATQRLRYERLMTRERAWDLASWQTNVINHPLVGSLASRLIWRFDSGAGAHIGGWREGRLVDAADVLLPEFEPPTRVTLVHPARLNAEETLAWQLWLERHRLTQPFKQAHREVYRLSEEERAIGDRSMRFGGRILDQRRFAALRRQRGWTHQLLASWGDLYQQPRLALGEGLWAEFQVETIEEMDLRTDDYLCRYVVTDRLVFERENGGSAETQRLDAIDPLVLSEVMRDVDFFVSAADGSADPDWEGRDRGEYAAFWRELGFGDLLESARARHALLGRLLPALSIAPRCQLMDQTLVVRGDVNEYHIDLATALVIRRPAYRHLCIGRIRAEDKFLDAERVYLPFEGDAVLGRILSIAFLLAEDSKISDPALRVQIEGRHVESVLRRLERP